MYDELVCDMDLPDGFDASNVVFQTKDLDCLMDRYTLEADGTLWLSEKSNWGHGPKTESEPPEIVNFSGDLNFYNSNIRSMGPGYYTTENDKPYWSREYQAIYNEGKLLIPIKVMESEDGTYGDGTRKHLTQSEFQEFFRGKVTNE